MSDFREYEIEDATDAAPCLLVRMSLQAEATSVAVRSALTHGLAAPALALVRARFEQCVVSSFLIHAPASDGWSKYMADVPAAQFEVTAKMEDMARPSVRVRPSLHDEVQEVGEGAYIDKSGRFKRRWADMPLEEMARRRDQWSAESSPFPWKLEEEYWRVYPIGSLAVHGACEATFWNIQLHEPDLGSGRQYPYLVPSRARVWAAALARYDVLQACEALAAVTTGPTHHAETLVALYDSASSRDA